MPLAIIKPKLAKAYANIKAKTPYHPQNSVNFEGLSPNISIIIYVAKENSHHYRISGGWIITFILMQNLVGYASRISGKIAQNTIANINIWVGNDFSKNVSRIF